MFYYFMIKKYCLHTCFTEVLFHFLCICIFTDGGILAKTVEQTCKLSCFLWIHITETFLLGCTQA